MRYSPDDFDVHEDPYPYYARLREQAPVFRNETDDCWALSRHADVRAALRDSDRADRLHRLGSQIGGLLIGAELHGVKIPAEERILLITGSANRDPEVFDNPDAFDMDRDTSASLLFGSGRQHCLGSSLGQLELRVALEEIVGLVADYDIDPERMRRIHSSNNRGFAALPTQVTAR